MTNPFITIYIQPINNNLVKFSFKKKLTKKGWQNPSFFNFIFFKRLGWLVRGGSWRGGLGVGKGKKDVAFFFIVFLFMSLIKLLTIDWFGGGERR